MHVLTLRSFAGGPNVSLLLELALSPPCALCLDEGYQLLFKFFGDDVRMQDKPLEDVHAAIHQRKRCPSGCCRTTTTPSFRHGVVGLVVAHKAR